MRTNEEEQQKELGKQLADNRDAHLVNAANRAIRAEATVIEMAKSIAKLEAYIVNLKACISLLTTDTSK